MKKIILDLCGGTMAREYSVPKCPPEYKRLKLDRAALRAITPPGFAQAFFEKNK